MPNIPRPIATDLASSMVLIDKHAETVEQMRACLDSLKKALKKAGGVPNAFTVSSLSQMSALELLLIIGPNHIRFEYEPPPEGETKE